MKNLVVALLFAGVVSVPLLTMPLVSHAQERQNGVVNISDTIVGNSEQPTVLYIVPWKQAEDNTILYLPLSPKVMEKLFTHVERVEHTRQIKYKEELEDK